MLDENESVSGLSAELIGGNSGNGGKRVSQESQEIPKAIDGYHYVWEAPKKLANGQLSSLASFVPPNILLDSEKYNGTL